MDAIIYPQPKPHRCSDNHIWLSVIEGHRYRRISMSVISIPVKHHRLFPYGRVCHPGWIRIFSDKFYLRVIGLMV